MKFPVGALFYDSSQHEYILIVDDNFDGEAEAHVNQDFHPHVNRAYHPSLWQVRYKEGSTVLTPEETARFEEQASHCRRIA
jgi:hypothetical protein